MIAAVPVYYHSSCIHGLTRVSRWRLHAEALAAGDFKDTVDFYLLNCSNDAAAMADFAKKNNVGTAMMHGGLVDDPGTCGAYGVQFIPHKVVIDKDGIVQHNGTGDIKGKIAEVAA